MKKVICAVLSAILLCVICTGCTTKTFRSNNDAVTMPPKEIIWVINSNIPFGLKKFPDLTNDFSLGYGMPGENTYLSIIGDNERLLFFTYPDDDNDYKGEIYLVGKLDEKFWDYLKAVLISCGKNEYYINRLIDEWRETSFNELDYYSDDEITLYFMTDAISRGNIGATIRLY